MTINNVYQIGLDELCESYNQLESTAEFGVKSEAIYQNSEITFHITNLRGLEIIALKNMANSVEIVSKNPFIEFKQVRSVLFSSTYPKVVETDEYKRFTTTVASIYNKIHDSIIPDSNTNISQEILTDACKLNFAGALSFDAIATFRGLNITRILSAFPGIKLRDENMNIRDLSSPKFVNFLVSVFKNKFYEEMDGLFSSMDIYTSVIMKKIYFSPLENMIKYDPTRKSIVSKILSPYGEINLLMPKSPDVEKSIQTILSRASNSNYNIPIDETELEKNLRFIMQVKCSVYSLIYLFVYTNIVIYYSDVKDTIGTDLSFDNAALFDITKSKYADNVEEIIQSINNERFNILSLMKKYNRETEEFEKNRKSLDVRNRPSKMINNIEAFNIIPLCSYTYASLNFSMKDLNELKQIKINNKTFDEYNPEIKSIINMMEEISQAVHVSIRNSMNK